MVNVNNTQHFNAAGWMTARVSGWRRKMTSEYEKDSIVLQ